MAIVTRSSLTVRKGPVPCERNDQNTILPMGDGDQLPNLDKQIQPPETAKKQTAKSNPRKRKYNEDSDLENSPVRKRSNKKTASKKGKASKKRKQRSSSPPRSNKKKKAKDSQSYTAANKQANDDSGVIRGMADTPRIMLVLDTNILLESGGLRFLEDLADGRYDVPGLPPMQVHIPHVVFLELDRQKNRKGGNGVGQRAGAAVRFLHNQMVDHRRLPQPITSSISLPMARSSNAVYIPRFAGQTARDFARAGRHFQQEIDDDHVLFCCLQLQERLQERDSVAGAAAVWCVTNDRNLRIRTVVNGAPAFSLSTILSNINMHKLGDTSIFDSV